jgi:hypothetical protein
MSEFYGTGAVLGFTPRQVDEMTLWEFAAICDGYAKANNPDYKDSMSDSEFDEIVDFLDQMKRAQK